MISYPWMDKNKNLFIVPGILLIVSFIAALWIIWQPLWELETSGASYVADRIISYRLPELKNNLRKILLLPSEENYRVVYQAINKNIFNKIDKRKDQSDNDAAQSAADTIFPITEEAASLKTSDTTNLTDNRNRFIWKFISDQGQTKPSDLINQGFASSRNNVLNMTLNPLSYIDYFLHQHYAVLALNENLKKFENNIKDSKISTTIVIHPKQQNFDPKIIRLEIDNLSFTSLILDEINLQLDTSADTKADLIFEKNGNFMPSGKILNSATTGKGDGLLKFSDINFQMTGKNSPDISKTILFVVSNQPIQLKSIELKLTNSLTKKQIKDSKFHLINDETFRYLENISQSPVEFVRQHPKFLLQNKGADKDSIVLLPPGKYSFPETIVIPETFSEVKILPGTTIKFAPGVSLISYSPVIAEGTVNSPIRFMAASSSRWGTFAIVNTKDKKSLIKHVSVEDAGPTTINGIIFSGGLAAHYADIDIFDSVFTRNHGDDGVNVKYSTADIERNKFIDNDSDGLDLDSVTGIIDDNQAIHNGFVSGSGDGIDISWTPAVISNNLLSGNKDKCLSVGEESTSKITGNIMQNCDIGVAVKDLSNVVLTKNTISHNRQGVSAYQKKPIFGGGIAKLDKNIFSDNQTDIWTDGQSIITDENK